MKSFSWGVNSQQLNIYEYFFSFAKNFIQRKVGQITVILLFSDDHVKERCCQGAKHFVNVWLPNYLEKRNKKYKKVNFGGAILLESILNYDSFRYAQNTDIGGHYTYQLVCILLSYSVVSFGLDMDLYICCWLHSCLYCMCLLNADTSKCRSIFFGSNK